MALVKFGVILLDRKRISCTFSPFDRIEQVLKAICERSDLDPSDYVLSYNNQFLYNGLQLRTLEFSEEDTLLLQEDFKPITDESVQVILQIKDNSISSYFRPDVTLWKVVQCLVASAILEIPNSTPVLIRKNVEYIGYNELSLVTLRSLHITKGSILFRFLVVDDYVLARRTPKLLSSSESLDFELTMSSDAERKVKSNRSGCKSGRKKNIIKFKTVIENRCTSVFEEMAYLGERNALAYRQESWARVSAKTNDFYDLLQDDVERLFSILHAKRNKLETMMLNPKARIKVKQHLTVIRVIFPDTLVLQGVFNANEKIKDVEEFVKLYRRVPKEFKLFLGPPKTILESAENLEHYKLVPTGKMFYTTVGNKHPGGTAYLKEDVLRHLSTEESACYAAAHCVMTFPDFDDDSTDSSSDSESSFSRILTPLDSQSSGFQVVN